MVVTSGYGGYRVFTCDTVTGFISGDLPVAGHKWGIRLNKAGTVSATIRANSKELKGVDLRAVTTGWVRSLGVAHNGAILECGPILDRQYNAGTGELTVTAAGLWSIFDRRAALPGAALALPGEQVTYKDLNLGPSSLNAIAHALVYFSLNDNPWGYGKLNVVLDEHGEGGIHVRNYKGYELRKVGEALRQLAAAENGPDIRFRPRFMGSDPRRVEWIMETGRQTQPLLQQAGNPWAWDGTRPGSGVVGFSSSESFEGMGSKAWAPGGGQERAMLLETAQDLTLPKLGYPWLEVDYASKQEEDRNVLRSRMQRTLYEAGFSVQTFDVSVRADAAPLLGAYLPGDWANVTIPSGHPTLDAGSRLVRIMAVDGDQSSTVKLTVAGMLGGIDGSGTGVGVIIADPGAESPSLFPDADLYPGVDVYPS